MYDYQIFRVHRSILFSTYQSVIFNNLCFNFQAVTFKDSLLPLFFEPTVYG